MKKITSFIIIFIFSVVLLNGCNSTKKLNINPYYRQMKAIEVSETELKEMIYEKGTYNEYKDFVLYIYDSTCSGCAYFETILERYIKETGIVIYKISYDKIDELIETPSKYKTNPRLILYKQGKLFSQITAEQNEKMFEDYDSMIKYFESKVVLSKMVIVSNLGALDYLYHQHEFIIYLGWDKCYDCQSMEKKFFNDYIKKNKLKTFYYYNVDKYRSQKNENPELWEAFANTYEFNINDNGGRVPTLLHVISGEAVDYVIYLNDNITINDDGSVRVNATSYGKTDQDYVGKTYNSYYDYVEAATPYHNSILKEFLDTYIKDN